MTDQRQSERPAFVDLLVLTRLDAPVAVQLTVLQPSGAEGRITLSAAQMDAVCAWWRHERAQVTVDASAGDPPRTLPRPSELDDQVLGG